MLRIVDGFETYPMLKPSAGRIAEIVVRAMLIITLHLFFDSLVISIVRFDFLRDVTVYAEDTSAVDEDLSEDVED